MGQYYKELSEEPKIAAAEMKNHYSRYPPPPPTTDFSEAKRTGKWKVLFAVYLMCINLNPAKRPTVKAMLQTFLNQNVHLISQASIIDAIDKEIAKVHFSRYTRL